jgi:hypothetical protein
MTIGIAAVLILIIGPLLLGLSGCVHAYRVPPHDGLRQEPPWNWRLSALSALLYAIAFNLTFFIQELFLVLPKAFTPGVRATLYHNNHTWQGDNPLAELFQGTGALAILVCGAVCLAALRPTPPRSAARQLFVIWMAYSGLLQALPQMVLGAVSSASDVGMALHYLQLSRPARTVLALAALVAIPLVSLRLARALLRLADDATRVAHSRARTRFVLRLATLPALFAILLILPFRVPRELSEVVLPPVVVTAIGIGWMQAGAWRLHESPVLNRPRPLSLGYPLVVLIAMLLVFQLVLRRGITF